MSITASSRRSRARPAQKLPQVSSAEVDAQLAAFLHGEGYRLMRVIQGKTCALQQFNFTIGLVVGLTFDGYERRYCFETVEDARDSLLSWDGTLHPPGPWIKCKGHGIDLLNPDLR
jgi:hypothetical protein